MVVAVRVDIIRWDVDLCTVPTIDQISREGSSTQYGWMSTRVRNGDVEHKQLPCIYRHPASMYSANDCRVNQARHAVTSS